MYFTHASDNFTRIVKRATVNRAEEQELTLQMFQKSVHAFDMALNHLGIHAVERKGRPYSMKSHRIFGSLLLLYGSEHTKEHTNRKLVIQGF